MWFKIDNNHVKITIIAKPNAKRTAFLRIDEQGMHVALHAKPQDGAANKELIAYLAKLLRVPKSEVILKQGEHGRKKQIVIPLTDSVQQFLSGSHKAN